MGNNLGLPEKETYIDKPIEGDSYYGYVKESLYEFDRHLESDENQNKVAGKTVNIHVELGGNKVTVDSAAGDIAWYPGTRGYHPTGGNDDGGGTEFHSGPDSNSNSKDGTKETVGSSFEAGKDESGKQRLTKCIIIIQYFVGQLSTGKVYMSNLYLTLHVLRVWVAMGSRRGCNYMHVHVVSLIACTITWTYCMPLP